MSNEIKDLLEMNEEDLYKQLGMKKRYAELSLLKSGTPTKDFKTVKNFKFDADVASLGIVSDSLSKLVQVGKGFFKELSSSAYNIVCGTASGNDLIKKVIGQGIDKAIVVVTGLLISQLAIAAAVAVIVATLIVKLFFDAGGKVLCKEWKETLPASA